MKRLKRVFIGIALTITLCILQGAQQTLLAQTDPGVNCGSYQNSYNTAEQTYYAYLGWYGFTCWMGECDSFYWHQVQAAEDMMEYWHRQLLNAGCY